MPKKELKNFNVAVPFTGVIYVSVAAENEEAAIKKCFDGSDEDVNEQIDLKNVEEWSAHQIIAEGNVFHGVCNEANAEEE